VNKRKICVVSGTRSEYGLLYWLMKEIQEDPGLELQLIATGMHLSNEFGLTYKKIEEDGFRIDEKVEMLLSSDTNVGIAKSTGLGVIGFADAFNRLTPDIVVLLGDRFEALAAAQVAMMLTIPIAHISGGELTQGAIDDSIRHAITKMAQYHFVSAEPYRKRVIQMGEHPDNVFNVGDPGIDNIMRLNLLSKKALQKRLSFELGDVYFLVTYHPVTLGNTNPEKTVMNLISALENFPKAKIIITKSNADAGGRIINEYIDNYALKQPERIYVAVSLGQLLYLSAMKHCDVVIGNSSSGIIEAPMLIKPTVNIGDRQKGRLKAQSIIDCREDTTSIVDAIKVALSPEFKKILPKVISLYGKSNTASQIKEFLKHVVLDKKPVKTFFDVPFSVDSPK
jgi:UDP-hydrolysing UDP-N-acetyl-D-glucosamine 2-epimerase